MIQAATPSVTELSRWKARLSVGRQVQEPHRSDWSRFREIYTYGDEVASILRLIRYRTDACRVNLVSAYVRSTLPRLIYKTPKVYCSARRPGDEESAKVDTVLLNYLYRELDVWNQLRLCGLDSILFGCSFMKLGFDSEYSFDAEDAVARIEGSAQLEAMRDQIREIREFAGLGPPLRELKAKTKPFNGEQKKTLEYNAYVVKERPWMLRVSPFDIVVDPDAKSLADAKWIAHRLVRPVNDVREDKSYTEQRERVQPEMFETAGDITGSLQQGDPVFPGYDNDPRAASSMGRFGQAIRSISRDNSAGYQRFGGEDGTRPGLVSIYEVWDRRTDTVRSIVMGLDGYLREPAANPFEIEGGFPFEMLLFNEVPDRFWPKSDISDMEPKQAEINKIRQYSLQWLKRIAAKVVTISRKGTLSQKEKDQLTSSEPFIHVEVETQGPLEDVIKKADLGDFDPAIYGIADQLLSDFRLESGMGSEQAGEAQSDTTATATAEASAARDIRIDEKRRAMEAFAARCARKLLQVCKQFFPPQVVVKLTGGSADSWVEVSAEDVRAELDVEIEADSATRPNDEVKRRQLVELLGTLTPLMLPNPMTRLPTLPPVWRSLIQPMLVAYGFSDPERILDGLEGKSPEGQDPMLQALMQAQQGVPGMPPGGGLSAPVEPSLAVGGSANGVPGAPAVPGGLPVGPGIGGQIRAQAGAV